MARPALRSLVAPLVAALALLALLAPAAAGFPPRVKRDFFGMNFQPVPFMSFADQERHLRAIRSLELRNVRVNVPWREIEPQPPQGGDHDYRWSQIDQLVAALARSRVRAAVTISDTPWWAEPDDLDVFEQSQCSSPGVRSLRPADLNSYGLAAAAVARRYGPGGTFWETFEGAPRPLTRFLLWNEANTLPNWCPAPDPVTYAQLVVGAAQRIKAVHPAAQVFVGGLPDVRPNGAPGYMQPGDFLGAMTAADPLWFRFVDGVGVNVFWFAPDEGPMARVNWFRRELRRGGVPDREPMAIAEVGWPILGPLAFSEAERTARMIQFTGRIPRSNCNVRTTFAHTWISPEQNHQDSEDWYGLANPATAEPRPAARAFAGLARTFRGKGERRPPRKPVRACPGMPLPDTDGDGVRDHRDRRPLNPRRS